MRFPYLPKVTPLAAYSILQCLNFNNLDQKTDFTSYQLSFKFFYVNTKVNKNSRNLEYAILFTLLDLEKVFFKTPNKYGAPQVRPIILLSKNDLLSCLSEALFTRIRIIIIPFYPKNVSSDRNSIHKYLDRLPILFTRSRIQFLSGQTLCG